MYNNSENWECPFWSYLSRFSVSLILIIVFGEDEVLNERWETVPRVNENSKWAWSGTQQSRSATVRLQEDPEKGKLNFV